MVSPIKNEEFVPLGSGIQSPATVNQADSAGHAIPLFGSQNNRTLCAHPKPNNSWSHASVGVISKSAVQSRISDCLNNGQPLISFHSERGFVNCKHLIDSKTPQPLLNSKYPSLVHQCLEAGKKGQEVVIEYQGKNYRLSVAVSHVQDKAQEDSVKLVKGSLQLQNVNDSNDRQAVPFVEFYPKFDGYALDSSTLVACHNALKEFRKENSLPALNGQFSSAKGICRSASLLVLDQFHEWCQVNDTAEFENEQVLRRRVISLVGNVQRSSSHAIPQDKQVTELVDACRKMYQQTRQSEVPDVQQVESDDEILSGELLSQTDEEDDGSLVFSENSEESEIQGFELLSPPNSPNSQRTPTKLAPVENHGVANKGDVISNEGNKDGFVESFWDDPDNLDSLKEFFVKGLGSDHKTKTENVHFLKRLVDQLREIISGPVDSFPAKLGLDRFEGFRNFLCELLEKEKVLKKTCIDEEVVDCFKLKEVDICIQHLSDLICDFDEMLKNNKGKLFVYWFECLVSGYKIQNDFYSSSK